MEWQTRMHDVSHTKRSNSTALDGSYGASNHIATQSICCALLLLHTAGMGTLVSLGAALGALVAVGSLVALGGCCWRSKNQKIV